VEPGLRQHAADATATARQARLGQKMRAPARTVGAPPLGQLVLHFLVHLLVHCSLRARCAAAPLGIATARDRQEPAYTREGKLPVLLVHPGVLHGSGWAQDAAAFFRRSRSAFQGAFSLRRRCSAS
jgi:hypothetical protein